MELTDYELVARCQNGDARAFQLLVERYQRRACGIAYGVLRNSDDAMDAAQEAFIKIYRNIDGFHNDCSFYTWLYRIVVNVCIDLIRRKSRRRTAAYDDTYHRKDEVEAMPVTGNTRDMMPGEQREREDLHSALNKALAGLSESHRTVIVLREIEGLSYEEIAEVCDCQIGTVMSRLHHARKKLQVSLQPYLKATGDLDLAALAGQGVRKSS